MDAFPRDLRASHPGSTVGLVFSWMAAATWLLSYRADAAGWYRMLVDGCDHYQRDGRSPFLRGGGKGERLRFGEWLSTRNVGVGWKADEQEAGCRGDAQREF